MICLRGSKYKENKIGPRTEPCGTPMDQAPDLENYHQRVLLHLLLEIQWRSVSSAPTYASCSDLGSTISLTTLLRHETDNLLREYKTHHGSKGESIPADVPNSAISGVNISEKLQDIITKNVLFYLHILKVEGYQETVWGNPESIAGPLSRVKGGLFNHLTKIKTILINISPEIPLPTPAPLQLSHSHDYAKKEYGCGVIVSLSEWLKAVLQVLEETKKKCEVAGSQSFYRGIPPIYT
ncbi:uncharacterized protein LOC130169923 [Seriola aureovittata]|uniref:uncharacterized protein LOC130169923 n=2 Tax=Seriola TaxID=8160 RepID=UPI0024BE36D6|nr:uncharacterized protein LOC130169923 [Seriola aureovittata]